MGVGREGRVDRRWVDGTTISLSTALIKLDFFFFLKSKSLIVRMLILIGRYVWRREAWDKLPSLSNLHYS